MGGSRQVPVIGRGGEIGVIAWSGVVWELVGRGADLVGLDWFGRAAWRNRHRPRILAGVFFAEKPVPRMHLENSAKISMMG